MRSVRLGQFGPEVSAVGLSCAAMSGLGQEDEGIATIHAAVDAGLTLLDTGDFYGAGGRNEMLVHEALWSVRRDQVLVAVSFGVQRAPDGALLGMDLRPASVKNYVTYSLRRIGIDYIDLYWPACPDPAVPIEDTVGAMADLVQAGYVRYVGLSNVSAQTIRRAHAVHPIAAVQASYSLLSRGAEREVLPTVRDLGIGFVAHDQGWLRRLGETADRERLGFGGGLRTRKEPAPTSRGRALAQVLEEIAAEKDVTAVRLALAWLLARGNDIVPLIDLCRPGDLANALGAEALRLSPEDIARIETAAQETVGTEAAAQGTPAPFDQVASLYFAPYDGVPYDRMEPHAIG